MLRIKHQGGAKRLACPVVQCCFAAVLFSASASAADPTVTEIIKASILSTAADWKATPRFSYIEQETSTKAGVTSSKTYRVLVIDGTPYSRLIAVGGKPISPPEESAEGAKLRDEIAKRANQSAQERADRVAAYHRNRDHMVTLLNEMGQAFEFTQVGEQRIGNYDTYVFKALPRHGYEPPNREIKLLASMRGTLWIDKNCYQWVKVEAEAFKPVTMEWSVAKVLPGTKFSLAQEPVTKALWLPQSFSVEVKAKVLWLWQQDFMRSEVYSDYHQNSSALP